MIKNLVFYVVLVMAFLYCTQYVVSIPILAEHPILLLLILTSLIGFLVLGFYGWGRFKPLLMALLYGMVFAMIVPIIGYAVFNSIDSSHRWILNAAIFLAFGFGFVGRLAWECGLGQELKELLKKK